MLNRAIQLAYLAGFNVLRATWRFRLPSQRGALVALWCGGEVLVVRHGYQRVWTLPGGGIHPGEAAMAAASRELREEVGVSLPASALQAALVSERLWNHRWDRVHIFAARVLHKPEVRIDAREIVEARWLTPAGLEGMSVPPQVRDYLERSPRGPGGDLHPHFGA
ncbi:MAG: NUDIX hydrolase [Deltaproteobacteria bacterium]|nr:NUDIX hydrolase [Deltaproteobacteria bacterium]